MSNSVVAIARRLVSPRASGTVIDVTPANEESFDRDLEYLASMIDSARRHKVTCDAKLIQAENEAKEAADDLNAAVDAYEKEVAARGLLCRK